MGHRPTYGASSRSSIAGAAARGRPAAAPPPLLPAPQAPLVLRAARARPVVVKAAKPDGYVDADNSGKERLGAGLLPGERGGESTAALQGLLVFYATLVL